MAAECANPLLAQFLKEWWDTAKERNSKGATTYKRAYESMIACPLTFQHPSEAQQLHGLGAKLCDRLADELKNHCEKNGLPLPKKSRKRKSLEGPEPPSQETPPSKKPRKTKPYVPKQESGAYAILMALSSLNENSDQRLSKSEICLLAQEHCEASFTVPSEPGKYYTAWNSMKTLEEKDLVYSKGRPQRKYQLTEEGWEVARRIRNADSTVGRAGRRDASTKESAPSMQAKPKVPKPSNLKASVSRASVDFLNLEDDFEDSDRVSAVKLPTLPNTAHSTSSTGTGEAGQRLGSSPVDKFGTYNPRKERLKAPSREIVRLDSSPEPEAASQPQKALWSFEQGFTENTSKSKARATLASNPPAPQPQKALWSFEQGFTENTSKSKARAAPASNAPAPLQPTHLPKETLQTFNAQAPIQHNHTSKEPYPTFQPITLQPGTFTIQLILDSREVRAKDDRDYIAKELTNKGIQATTRALELGDFFWVAKANDPHLLTRYGEEGSEIALDYIVERKRLDDLIASVKDRRFHEQKFRLRRSGVKNVVYLIEDITLSSEHATRYRDMMETAIGETQVLDGYFIKRTAKLDDTIRYLARMTRLLKSLYEQKPLHVIPTKHIDAQTYLPFITHLRNTQPGKSYNITYPSFASLASKSDTTTLRVSLSFPFHRSFVAGSSHFGSVFY